MLFGFHVEEIRLLTQAWILCFHYSIDMVLEKLLLLWIKTHLNEFLHLLSEHFKHDNVNFFWNYWYFFIHNHATHFIIMCRCTLVSDHHLNNFILPLYLRLVSWNYVAGIQNIAISFNFLFSIILFISLLKKKNQ